MAEIPWNGRVSPGEMVFFGGFYLENMVVLNQEIWWLISISRYLLLIFLLGQVLFLLDYLSSLWQICQASSSLGVHGRALRPPGDI